MIRVLFLCASPVPSSAVDAKNFPRGSTFQLAFIERPSLLYFFLCYYAKYTTYSMSLYLTKRAFMCTCLLNDCVVGHARAIVIKNDASSNHSKKQEMQLKRYSQLYLFSRKC